MNKFPFLVLVFCCLFVTVFCVTASADTVSEPEQTVSELVSEVEQFHSEVSSRLEEYKEAESTPVPVASASPEPVTLSTVNDTLTIIVILVCCLIGVSVGSAFVHFLLR